MFIYKTCNRTRIGHNMSQRQFACSQQLQHACQQHQQQRHCQRSTASCECLRPVIRVFGLLTSFVICGVGVDVYMHGYQDGLYILLAALLVLFIEIKWLITIFLHLLCGADNYHGQSRLIYSSKHAACGYGCLSCWRLAALLGGWRPAPLYIVVGVALMLWPHNLWLSYVAGVQLLLLALLRLCLRLPLSRSRRGKDEGLLPQCDFEKVSGCADADDNDFAEISAQLEDDEPMDDDIC